MTDLHTAAARAGLTERWLTRLGLTPAYLRDSDPDTHHRPDPIDLPLPAGRWNPNPGPNGRRRPFGGWAANVDRGRQWSGTSAQVQGMFPFPAPSGARVRGVPFGRHLHTAEPVGLDPAQWLLDGLITNTGVWIQGQPGVGKSTAAKRLMIGLIAYGFGCVIPGDLKDEYSPIVEALGGAVFQVGRGLHSLNPLDLGPMRAGIAATVGARRDQLVSQARGRRLDLLEALVTIVGGEALSSTERLLLAMGVDIADTAHANTNLPDPTIPDVVKMIDRGGPDLWRVVAADNDTEYRRRIVDLRNTLVLLCEGPIKGMFDRPSSFAVDPDLPAVSLSLKAIGDDGDDVVSAAMMCAWAWSSGLIDGSAATGRARNIVQIQDELWRALRAAPGLVERTDRMTRLNRDKGIVSIQSTHSLTDLEALPTETDRAKARGMAARNGVKILGGLDNAEMDRLEAIMPFTSAERALVTGWSAPPTWIPGQLHPGRGRYLIKSGGRMGLPVALDLSPAELRLFDTDRAWSGIRPRA